jgi:type III pantothenate kinase
MNPRLLIDAGNTRVKWAVVDAGRWVAQGGGDYADWSGLDGVLAPGMDCFVASVAGAGQAGRLAEVLETAGIEPTWLAPSAECAGVTNSYLTPAQLGVDRWMGLFGARARTGDATLVVSAGTALTVDALTAGGVFLGGVITPGVGLMRRSLADGLARVSQTAGQWQAFPRCTADAVESGIAAALCGAIEQQYARLASVSSGPPRCLLGGGDAEMLLPHLGVPAEHAPALVLEGIERVAKESRAE